MSSSQRTFPRHALCFALAIILGLSALVIIVPLMRSRTVATPDPLTVSDKTYAGKAIKTQEEDLTSTDKAKELQIDWNAWHKVNPDLAGWLTIPSLKLSLPIVQARRDDPSYYLNHDVYGNENLYGCPFIDSDCADEGLNSRHAIIMGHSLTDGSMFTPLLSYADETFAREHSKVLIYTPKKTHMYTIRRASIVAGNEMTKSSAFESEEAFSNWLFDEDARALYTLDTAPAICGISLVTCSYFKDPTNERFVLFCTPQQEALSSPAQAQPASSTTAQCTLAHNQPSGLMRLPDTGPAVWKPATG